jgi:hypothetical protein
MLLELQRPRSTWPCVFCLSRFASLDLLFSFFDQVVSTGSGAPSFCRPSIDLVPCRFNRSGHLRAGTALDVVPRDCAYIRADIVVRCTDVLRVASLWLTRVVPYRWLLWRLQCRNTRNSRWLDVDAIVLLYFIALCFAERVPLPDAPQRSDMPAADMTVIMTGIRHRTALYYSLCRLYLLGSEPRCLVRNIPRLVVGETSATQHMPLPAPMTLLFIDGQALPAFRLRLRPPADTCNIIRHHRNATIADARFRGLLASRDRWNTSTGSCHIPQATCSAPKR